MSVITVRNLATIGRLGNMLHLYAFARGYARAHNCELQVPQWIGREVFPECANDSFITRTDLRSVENDAITKRPLDRYFGITDIDLNVFAQHQIYLQFYSRADVWKWFKIDPMLVELCGPSLGRYSALHLRRGDYLSKEFIGHYATVQDASYERAIRQFHVPDPVLRIGEGLNAVAPFLPPEMSWLKDFVTLRDAAVLLRANSSFSWWAAVLSAGKVYSPVVGDKTGWQDVEFVEGNHPCTAGKFRNQSDLFVKEV